MRWTEDDIEFVKVATESGWTAKEVASELGRSLDSVISKRHRLGIQAKTGRPKEYTKEELIRFLKDSPNKTYDYFNSKDSGTPAATTYRQYFGSWEKALEAAGLEHNVSTMSEHLPTIVYLVEFGGFYKIGITQRTVNKRLDNRYPNYTVILQIETSLSEARELEKKWLGSVKDFKFQPDNFPKEGRGFNECFKY